MSHGGGGPGGSRGRDPRLRALQLLQGAQPRVWGEPQGGWPGRGGQGGQGGEDGASGGWSEKALKGTQGPWLRLRTRRGQRIEELGVWGCFKKPGPTDGVQKPTRGASRGPPGGAHLAGVKAPTGEGLAAALLHTRPRRGCRSGSPGDLALASAEPPKSGTNCLPRANSRLASRAQAGACEE